MSDNKGVLVIGEIINGNLAQTTCELLGCGRGLVEQLNEPLFCAFITDDAGNIPNKAIESGADKVFIVTDALFKEYQNEMFSYAAEKIINEVKPRLVLIAQSSMGRDLAPTLAFKLDVSLAMDCLDIRWNSQSNTFELTRSVYGGNALATYVSDTIPQIATVRAKVMTPSIPDSSRKGEIIPINIDRAQLSPKTKVIQTIKEEVSGIKLEDAAIVIAGGRGIGGKEGFIQLEALAKILKAAVGATRPPCDNGWWPETAQVGLTGKIVSPDLYIAVAISGASQHMAGCSGAKNIVAINKDPEANIFKFARFGIVGDWKQILPAFTEAVQKLVAS